MNFVVKGLQIPGEDKLERQLRSSATASIPNFRQISQASQSPGRLDPRFCFVFAHALFPNTSDMLFAGISF